MSQLAPAPAQKRLAGQIAWERGQKIVNWPTTSSALSGLIAHLKAEYQPLPIADWQLDKFRRLVSECVSRVQDFDAAAYSEVPEDRTSANKALYALERMLNAVAYREGVSNAGQFLIAADDSTPTEAVAEANVAADVEASTEQTDDIPF